jgi:sulfate permease, SulP family
MSTTSPKKKIGRIILMEGILPVDRTRIPMDIIAGMTLAALAIPEVMGYTKIAGMPVVTGLYTILIPMIIYAFFGSSRHLVVGADSATAAIMAAGLVGLAAAASAEYIAYAGILALISAGLLILARLAKLGFIADFLSRTVLIGFLTGVGIQVAIGQITGMLGINTGGTDVVSTLVADIKQLGKTNLYTLVISIAVLAIIIGCRRINRKIPGALIAVIGAILLSYFLDFSSYGVAVLGTVPGGLPKIGLPMGLSMNTGVMQKLLPIAFSMFIVILAQSAATSRAYAARYNEKFNENSDLVGLGLANIGAGLSGAFVVNGSPTKTQMVDSAGGRSQLATLTTSIIVLIVLLFLTKPLAFLPEAVLSAVVFLIGIELVDIAGMRRILAQRPAEFWVALITALVVILFGVEQGILLAIVLSILSHTRHGYKPKNAVLSVDSSGRPHMTPVSTDAQALPGLMIYRFHHSLYFANAEQFAQEVLALVANPQPPLRWFCIDATAIDDIDYTASDTLRDTYTLLQGKGIRLVLAEVDDDVRRELERSEIINLIGQEVVFETLNDVESAYKTIVLDNQVRTDQSSQDIRNNTDHS